MKKKNYLILGIVLLVLIVIGIILSTSNNNSNLIELSYNEILEKVNNKEDFVLCVSASECSHCMSYKPKLKKVSNKYNIKIYYVDVDTLTKEDYSEFKDKFSFDGSTPVTIFFKEGEEKTTATRIEGDVSTDRIISKLKKNGFIDD